MARILLVGGGCRGLALAERLLADGHAVRITTRSEGGRGAIEALGAECWLGTPERLATLRGVLDGVAIACWLLATARGDERELAELHRERLQFFLGQLIDTTVRGFVYEAGPPGVAGAQPAHAAAGEQIARRLAAENAIPLELLRADPADRDSWLAAASGAIGSLLGGA